MIRREKKILDVRETPNYIVVLIFNGLSEEVRVVPKPRSRTGIRMGRLLDFREV